MGEVTKIEWADHTFNPWIGCTNVSPACDNCYAEAMMDKRYGRAKWGAGQPRVRTSAPNWSKVKGWHRDAVASEMRPLVFCASLADVFDNEIDPAWRADLFRLICETPQLVWLLLTKRVGNVMAMSQAAMGKLYDRHGIIPVEPLPSNVAIGASFANQAEYDRDRMKLREVRQKLSPAFTFGSFEPLLGRVILDCNAPDWIIVGGESGPNARPMDIDNARYLRDQSRDLGRVFNFKQVGGRTADKGGHLLDGKAYLDRPVVKALEIAA